MALEPLATLAELGTLGGDTSDASLAALALNAASAAVREAAGVPISRQTSTFTLPAPQSRWLDLPVSPVISVTSVEVDGVESTEHRFTGGRLYLARGWAVSSCEPVDVTVTVVHGFSEVPADIVSLTCHLAAYLVNRASEAGGSLGVRSEGIDDHQVTYTDAGTTGDLMTILEESGARVRLAQRFGGGSYVTGDR